ncbi:hypothetical protein [Actinoplanes sp. GCM10030250]|uniref:hypothetical protein n=1 Tax=Actinoplanes sp. GCM10030250 TaxID=3273376 RepID=UPI003611D0C1
MNSHQQTPDDDRLVERLLEHLRNESCDLRLRDLADDVLNGRLSLAEAMATSTAAEAISPRLPDFLNWFHGLDDNALAEYVDQRETPT